MKQKVLIFKPGVDHNDRVIESAKIIDPKVPVWIDFDRSLPPVGSAFLTTDEEGNIYADMDVNVKTLAGLFPAIGGQYLPGNVINITETSICKGPNADPRIQPFK